MTHRRSGSARRVPVPRPHRTILGALPLAVLIAGGAAAQEPAAGKVEHLAAFARLIGEDPYIRYLASFRYPLSGEFAVQRDLATRMRLPSDWGLEIVTLFEALRHRGTVRICQVEIAERYDHKHQDLSVDDPAGGLNRMAASSKYSRPSR